MKDILFDDMPMPGLETVCDPESDSDDEDSAVIDEEGSRDGDDTATSLKEDIFAALNDGAAWNRKFMRGFGALRTETHLAENLSTREKTHMMALWTQIPGTVWKNGMVVKNGKQVNSLLWDFGVRD